MSDETVNVDGPGQLASGDGDVYAEQQRAADEPAPGAPSDGFPVKVEKIDLDVAVDLLKRTHKYVGDDILAQQVWGFIKAHGG